MIRVGLTGGCCTGKSTVAQMFSRMGADVLNADVIVHQLLREDQEIIAAVVSRFGDRVLAEDGTIDRRVLADIVFRDTESLRRLTELLYPKVRRAIGQFFEEKKSPARGEKLCVAEVPLLVEGGALDLYDVIVVVKASYENQLRRFQQRGGTKADFDRRIANQMNMTEKVKVADYVINNNGTVEETLEQVKTVYDTIRSDRNAFGEARAASGTEGRTESQIDKEEYKAGG